LNGTSLKSLRKRLQRHLFRGRRDELQQQAKETAELFNQQNNEPHCPERDQSKWRVLKEKLFFLLAVALVAIVTGGHGMATVPLLIFFAAFVLLWDVLARIFGAFFSVAIFGVGCIVIAATFGFYTS